MSRPRLSIRRKLLGLLVLFSLGPLLMLAYIDHQALSRFGALVAAEWGESLGAQARQALTEQADAHALLLTRALEQIESGVDIQARIIARELTLAEATKSRTVPPSPAVALRFHGTTRDTQSPRAAQLLKVAGEMALLRDAQAMPELQQAISLGPDVSAVYPAKASFPAAFLPLRLPEEARAVSSEIRSADDIDWIIASARIPGENGWPPGAAALSFPVRSLQTWLPAHRGDTTLGFPLFVRADGPGIEILAPVGDEPLPAEVLTALRSGASPPVASLMRTLRAGEPGQRLLTIAGRQLFCMYRPLPDLNAQLLWLVPADQATGNARAAATYALISARRQGDAVLPLLLTAGLAIALVAAYAARSVTQPVSQLKGVMETVAGGDFSARVNIETGDELEVLGHTFNRMIPQLEEETRLQQSLALAREVQQRMLPVAPPSFPGIELAGLTRYCEQTGGDYFDYLDGRPQGSQTLGVVIGDVTGHGTPAALLMTTARALLHGLLAAGASPHASLQQLNQQIAADIRPGHFMTLFYLTLDLASRQLRWASAGHEPAFWWHAAHGQVTSLAGEDIPLGVDGGWQFTPLAEADFQAGDTLLLVTDGVCETRNLAGEAFGRERLGQLLSRLGGSSAELVVAGVLAALDGFAGNGPARDDLSIVVVRVTA